MRVLLLIIRTNPRKLPVPFPPSICSKMPVSLLSTITFLLQINLSLSKISSTKIVQFWLIPGLWPCEHV